MRRAGNVIRRLSHRERDSFIRWRIFVDFHFWSSEVPLRSAVVGAIEIEYFYDGNYFVEKFRDTRDDAKYRFPENIGETWLTTREGKRREWTESEVQSIKPEDPLVDNFSTQKIQTPSQFQVPSNWIRTKSCRTTSGIASFPRHLATEDLTEAFETRNERRGGCGS